jgi:hypothetical protein
MPVRCYPCPRTGVTHVSRTNNSETGSVSDSARTAGNERAFTIESHVQYLRKIVTLDSFLFGQQSRCE